MVAHRVPDPLGTGKQCFCAAGATGLALWVPDPLRALTNPKNASGAPVVAHRVPDPLGTGKQCFCAAGAPRLALWVPDPWGALTVPPDTLGAQQISWPLATPQSR